MRNLTLLLLAFLSMPAIGAAQREAADSTSAAGPGIVIASDNEGFSTRRFIAEYWHQPAPEQASMGVRYRHHRFAQGDWSRTAEQLSLIGKGDLGVDGGNWQAEAGVLSQGGRQLLTLDANLLTRLTKATTVEAFANRDYVETERALDYGIHATFVGASLEQQLHPQWTIVGLAGYQDFSDGNHRNHARLRLIWQPDLDAGFTLQYRFRYFDSGDSDVPRAYFNPDSYQENMLMAGWRKRGKGWHGHLLAGVGRQNIEATGAAPTALLEGSLEKQLDRRHSLSLRAGLNRSASFGGPDYRYRYLQANWLMKF